jgi:DNA-directed RNA polymerase specialized sigma24 family protein
MWFGSEAEDAVSRMWVNALRYWDSWEGRASRKTWLTRVLRTEGLKHMQTHLRFVDLQAQPVAPVFAQQFEDSQRLLHILRQLKASDREALIVWAAHGAPKTGKFRVRVHRALKKARVIAHGKEERRPRSQVAQASRSN